MDAGVADTLNRIDAQLMARKMDSADRFQQIRRPFLTAWYTRHYADMIVANAPQSRADIAWFIGTLAGRTPDVQFRDGIPAGDADWDNLISHFRAEILARRDPKSHPACAAEIPARDGVGSR